MPFRLQTMCNAGWCQRRCCVQTQECHETSTTAVRNSSFFMYEVSLRYFYVQSLFLESEFPCCSILDPFVDGSPYLFYAKNICHLDSLLEPIKNIVNPKLSGWKTHITIFSTIAVTAIHLTNAFRSQKWLYIHPSSFFLESLLIVLTQNQVASRIILLQPMRSNRLSRYWRLMKGYKVIFESWGEVYRSYDNGCFWSAQATW